MLALSIPGIYCPVQIPPYLDDSANDSEEDLALENDPLQLELRQRQQEVDR